MSEAEFSNTGFSRFHSSAPALCGFSCCSHSRDLHAASLLFLDTPCSFFTHGGLSFSQRISHAGLKPGYSKGFQIQFLFLPCTRYNLKKKTTLFLFKKCSLIWLSQVLVAAHGTVTAVRAFSSCGTGAPEGSGSVAALWFRRSGCSASCGILVPQSGSHLCPLPYKADS